MKILISIGDEKMFFDSKDCNIVVSIENNDTIYQDQKTIYAGKKKEKNKLIREYIKTFYTKKGTKKNV